jgi:hypothetical protein
MLKNRVLLCLEVCAHKRNLFKSILKFICICFLLKKIVNKKKLIKFFFSLLSKKIFSFYFRLKTSFRSCEKFRNIMLFAYYIKFDPQTFNYYIFCFEFFFSISSIRIWFNLIFISTLILIFMIVICFSLNIFLIEIFYLSDFILILLIVIYFIWNNLWNHNYYFFNFIIFQLFNL